MERDLIINDLKKYFNIHELVSPKVYNKMGSGAWCLFDTDALETLLFIRENLGKSITINNWFWGGKFKQRGFRENTSSIVSKKTEKDVVYLSGHVIGKAFDFDVKGMEAEEVRDWLKEKASELPCKIRLEHKKNGEPINWVHLDTKHYPDKPKVYLFDV